MYAFNKVFIKQEESLIIQMVYPGFITLHVPHIGLPEDQGTRWSN